MHYIKDTLHIGPQHSGLQMIGHPDEEATVSGGVELSGPTLICPCFYLRVLNTKPRGLLYMSRQQTSTTVLKASIDFMLVAWASRL